MSPSLDSDQYRMGEIDVSDEPIDVDAILLVRPNLTYIDGKAETIVILIQIKDFYVLDAYFDLATILFICIIIVYLLNSIGKPINSLIITPIEEMMELVVNKKRTKLTDSEPIDQKYETVIVQKALIKIKALLQIVFGQIGCDIIYDKLFKYTCAEQYLLDSKRNICIFGLCHIQNFDEYYKILGDDALKLVNQLAEIVHLATYRYGGQAVSNSGDSFLIVFPLTQSDQIARVNNDREKNCKLSIQCDYALFSFVKIFVRMNKEHKFNQFRKDPRLLQSLGSNFELSINCVLDIGSCVTGLVGSSFKLDVQTQGLKVAELKHVLKSFRTLHNVILFNSEFHNCLTSGLRKFCRIVDQMVCQPISPDDPPQPVKTIYTIDTDLTNISPSRNKAEKNKDQQMDVFLKRAINMEALRDDIQIENYNAQAFVNNKKQLREVLRNAITEEIRQKYYRAYQLYRTQEWKEAKPFLEEVMRLRRQDQIVRRLYSIVESHNFESPHREQQ